MNSYAQTFASLFMRNLFQLLSILAMTCAGTSVLADAAEEIAPDPTLVKVPSFSEKLWQDRPLASLKATLKRTEGELPPNLASSRIFEASRVLQSGSECRPWVITACEWDAPGTCHLPLFFEEPNLERMGYREGCHLECFEHDDCHWTPSCLQPVISGAHFFGSLATVPYQCGYLPPCQPVSTLGVDRPGSPICYRRHLTPLSCRGAIYQAGVITGLVFILP